MLFKRCITPNLYKDEIKEIENVLKKHATDSLQF